MPIRIAPGRPEPSHHRCVGSRRGASCDPRRGGGRDPGDVDQVLDRHRHSVERSTIPPGGDLPVGSVGVDPGALVEHRREGPQRRVAVGDAGEGRVDHLPYRHRARFDRRGQPMDRVLAPAGGHRGSSGHVAGSAASTAGRWPGRVTVPAGGTKDARGVRQHVEERLQRGEVAPVGVRLGGNQPLVKRHFPWGSAPHPGSVARGDPDAPRRSLAGAHVRAVLPWGSAPHPGSVVFSRGYAPNPTRARTCASVPVAEAPNK